MKSIIQKAFESGYERLHPKMQKGFDLNSVYGLASMCTGVTEEIWSGGFLVAPSLHLASLRKIMFSATGKNVSFTLEIYPFVDKLYREATLRIGKFKFPDKERRFDTTMIYSEEKAKLTDYMGTHRQMAVEIDASVSDKGGVRPRSGDGRFYEGIIGGKMPKSLSAVADGHVWYGEEEKRVKIKVDVKSDLLEPACGYNGYYDCEYFDIEEAGVPEELKPAREERRE